LRRGSEWVAPWHDPLRKRPPCSASAGGDTVATAPATRDSEPAHTAYVEVRTLRTTLHPAPRQYHPFTPVVSYRVREGGTGRGSARCALFVGRTDECGEHLMPSGCITVQRMQRLHPRTIAAQGLALSGVPPCCITSVEGAHRSLVVSCTLVGDVAELSWPMAPGPSERYIRISVL
jgi:hypothetical protein